MMSANKDLQPGHQENTVSKQDHSSCLNRTGENLNLYAYLEAPDNAGPPPGATGIEDEEEEVAVLT